MLVTPSLVDFFLAVLLVAALGQVPGGERLERNRVALHHDVVPAEFAPRAENAAVAKTLAAAQPIDLALVDINMPGESGYALLRTVREHPSDTIRTVAAGGSLLDPTAAATVLERMRRGWMPDDPRYATLSPQERRILGHIADGRTNRQIGAEMHLAEKTVKNYVSSLLHKLGVTRRTEAAVFATELRLPGR